ncbi:MAG: TolC family outer membrane protein [Burkholderiales bacterium]|nr:TolC family outer membrane protein [Burkholderiales bacterium]MBL6878514.1 TolC family outer membrane protein [Burkholderiales bacterium]
MIRLVAVLISSLFGSVQAVDLLDLYTEAVTHDARYAAAKARYLSVQERLPQAQAGRLPKINLEAGYNYNSVDAETAFSSGHSDYGSYEYGVTATQPLYRKQNDVAIDLAQLEIIKANTQLEIANQNLMLRTLRAYSDVLVARTNLGTVRAQKVAISEQLELAKRNFSVGTATITDQREAKAGLDLVLAEELAAKNDLRVSKEALQELVGGPVSETLAPLKMPVKLEAPVPSDIKLWVQRATEQSLEMVLAQHEVGIAKARVHFNRLGAAPTLDLVGSIVDNYAGNSSFGSGAEATAGVVGLRFQVPLFEGGKVNSETREAIAQYDKASLDLEYVKRKVAQDARVAYLDYTTGIARIDALEQALLSTKLQLESTKLGLEVGVRTAVDVLDAEKLLSEARRAMLGAIYDSILAKFQLQAVTGRLTEADLVAINDLFVQ